MKNKTYNKRKVFVVFVIAFILLLGLIGRLVYLMIFEAEYYQKKAEDLHQREREIKAARGKIVDANGVVLATNKSVCTISVIHSQIEDKEEVIRVLSKELGMEEPSIRAKVEKVSSREKIKSNVEIEIGNRIRNYELAGVKVDEDYKRYYPYEELASKVIGFTGADNQGIIGLEVMYEEYLKGQNGTILTTTDARGIELEDIAEDRLEPTNGKTLQISIDYNIQSYAQQMAEKVLAEKEAEKVGVIIMNPQNGEIMAMVNVPEFDLNTPFSLESLQLETEPSEEDKQNLLNQMWRNSCINDTYEPGSTFKTFTTAAALEASVLTVQDSFYCPGYRIVEDRKIRCHKVAGHGAETFVEGIQNSCNPVFMDVGQKLGVENFYTYLNKFGLMQKTGVDLPGEAGTIMHKKENVGPVELATMSFGQSFQITPLQLATTISSLVNGGIRITPHFGVRVLDEDGSILEEFSYKNSERIVSEGTSKTLQVLLESVISEGTGSNAYIEGYEIGGKTATSQTLPRSANKYISSFVGFAPADNPQVLGLILIYDPQGTYYGGTIAAPVMRTIFENILPYLGIEMKAN